MRAYQIKIEIYEPGTDFPIVVHLFHGRDPSHAERIHQAHKRADDFLRGCEDRSCFGESVPCTTKISRTWVTVR